MEIFLAHIIFLIWRHQNHEPLAINKECPINPFHTHNTIEMKVLIVLVLSAITTGGWVIDRCSVVRAVRSSGIAGYKGYTEGDYVCLVRYASNYETSLNRSPTEYGAFQINSYFWCDDYKTPGHRNACGISCAALLDTNLADDLRCVKRIVQDPNGLDAWQAWTRNCKGRDNSYFTVGC
ncbi:lysozyme C-1-like [Hyla sarda]|uniref:lysozyme C-1-like n=1 Tax=Hyla sarda TaxID=327740 RepID=UPI0024C38B9E|nr:lysozyme C-1-like [Hyla sarda]XP_056404705.1 lysozyme C-1-like [Hyla sarda]XP_056404706.1 lysozyme C-1-like [Hyla sarda]XP_056404707.1 lysozyme C-1-like [Hyla sarda]XP_056404709.1 lysozyme C-1-like [Hyla sarda]